MNEDPALVEGRVLGLRHHAEYFAEMRVVRSPGKWAAARRRETERQAGEQGRW